jgi:hypothetical protein
LEENLHVRKKEKNLISEKDFLLKQDGGPPIEKIVILYELEGIILLWIKKSATKILSRR